MSHSHEVDNEEALFQFDSYEGVVEGDALETSSLTHTRPISIVHATHNLLTFAQSSPDLLSNTLDQAIDREMDGRENIGAIQEGKGKGVSKPMPIRAQASADSRHDYFDIGPPGPRYHAHDNQPGTSHTHSSPTPSSPLSASFSLDSLQTPLDESFQRFTIAGEDDPLPIPGSFEEDSQMASGSFTGKGKARELAPILPPLEFSPTEFGYSKADWPSPGLITPTPGPSSYGSGYGSVIESSINLSAAVQNQASPQSPPTVRRMPSRRRSLSNLSIRSTRSMAELSMSRIKGAAKGPGNLARKLLSRSRPGSNAPTPPTTPGATTPGGHLIDGDIRAGQGSCLMPWRNDFKAHAERVPPVPFLSLEAKLNAQTLPVYRRSHTAVDLDSKGRSYSSPLPISALDIVPSAPADIFIPIQVIPRNYFDIVLPRELRLRVFECLILSHEKEHQQVVQDGEWTVLKASSSKNRWVGKEKAMRELVKFSRVSKTWQALVFDGQMWSNLDLRAFPKIPATLLRRISENAGTFMTTADLSGHGSLLPSTLLYITDELCLKPGPASHLPHTQLTTLNLQGCAALTTRSLHHLLMRSPSLNTICLKGLTAVTNSTCTVLGMYCAQLVSVDIGRCLNVDGEGIRSFIAARMARGEASYLKELRASGIKRVNDEVLATLGKGAPLLEVLDLSYVRDLHNSALEAFVSCSDDPDEDVAIETVWLTAREAGREPGDTGRYRRRVTRLRHLSLSACTLLTDIACSNLAYTLPRLEFLELAGIGPELKDDGLVRLLNTTPLIRKLDLEDASEITDRSVVAVTPSSEADNTNRGVTEAAMTGHALEHLVISYATNVTDESMSSLIKNCTRLKVLEADNTRISGPALEEFVRQTRTRQTVDPIVCVIDCRGVGESVVKKLSVSTRPRKGWRSYEARKLGYNDGRDMEDLNVGRDECDEKRVVLKSFYSWQTVDAVRAAREKRKRDRRAANASHGSASDGEDMSTSGRASGARWWTPSGRRSSGTTSPTILDTNNDRDQCRIM